MTGFRIEPDALVAFAQRCEGYGEQMDTLSANLAEATVGRDAFGHIPQVGSSIYEAYDDHVDKCKESALSAAGMIKGVSANVAVTAAQYMAAERQNGAG